MFYNFLGGSGSELGEQRGPRTMQSRVLPVPGSARCCCLPPLKSMAGADWTMMTHPAPAPAHNRQGRGEAQNSF